MSKRIKPVKVTIISQTKKGEPYQQEATMSAYHFAKIDEIMQNAAKRFKVYTIIAPDGTVIAQLV